MKNKDSFVIYDKNYFAGPPGVYYYAPLDKIYWLKNSEETQTYDEKKNKLIRLFLYDFETDSVKYKKVALKAPKPGEFFRLDEE